MLSRIHLRVGFAVSLVLLLSACDPAPPSEPAPTQAPSLAIEKPPAPAQAATPQNSDAGSGAVSTGAVGAVEPLDCKKITSSSDPNTLLRPNVSCGRLSVPELHSDPNGKRIKIGFAQFKSGLTTPAKDAVLFVGDPGFSGMVWVSYWEYEFINKLLQGRDFVVVDTRGAGQSDPALKCNGELDEIVAGASKKALTAEDWDALSRSQAERCKAAWQTAGVNLAAYNSAEIAQDLDDVRRALGYEKLDVWGSSYGTVPVQLLMKLRPDIVRSAVLDSPIPSQANLHTAAAPAIERVLNQVFETCQADAKCNKGYPDFKQVFFDTVNKLNGKPMRINVTKPKGDFMDYFANGNDLINAAVRYLGYGEDAVENLPGDLYAFAFRGQKSMVESTLRNMLWATDNRSGAASLAVFCMDEGAATSGEDVKTTYSEAMQPYGDVFGVGTRAEICKAWGLPQLAGSEDAVTSDIPTLILSGDWDLNTLPDWPAQVAQGLKNSYSFRFFKYAADAGLTYNDQCASTMLATFVANPSQAPESTCMRSLSPLAFEIKAVERK